MLSVKTKFLLVSALHILVFCASTHVYAKTDVKCDPKDGDCVEVGSWHFALAVGVGLRTNPIMGEDNIPIFLLPSVSYYGERFFWETDTIGFTLVEVGNHMINAIGTVSYDQIYFDDIGIGNFSIEGRSASSGSGTSSFSGNFVQTDPGVSRDPVMNDDSEDNSTGGLLAQGAEASTLNTDLLHDRDITGLAGFEYTYNSRYFHLGLQILQDAASVHDGRQFRGAISKAFNWPRNAIDVSVGAEWKDSKTLDYFYGVRRDEVNDPAEVYIVDDDISYYVKMDWQYRLSSRWSLHSIVHNRWFGDEVRNSPIVAEDTTLALFLGGEYHF